MSMATTNLQTKSGKQLHPIGIGTWGYGEYPLFSPGAQAEVEAIRYAISLGQNHIDTAEMYASGGAERIVAKAVKPVSREDLFVASKLWKNHVARGTVRPAVEGMLRRFGTGYLDLLYIHAPWFDAPWQEAIPQIGELIDEGVVRYFGVSNFNAARLQEAMKLTKYRIAANQMHFSCTHQQEATPQLRELCTKNHITIVAYMPLEKGDIFNNQLLMRMSEKYNASPAQVALAWLTSQNALPIPKSVRKSHIASNTLAEQLQLLPEDVLRISALF